VSNYRVMAISLLGGKGVSLFVQEYPSLESYWRSVILFGQNVASYKFALAKSLLEVSPTTDSFISLEDLSEHFSRHILEHLKHLSTLVKNITWASSLKTN
jgi:hypothetical protein